MRGSPRSVVTTLTVRDGSDPGVNQQRPRQSGKRKTPHRSRSGVGVEFDTSAPVDIARVAARVIAAAGTDALGD